MARQMDPFTDNELRTQDRDPAEWRKVVAHLVDLVEKRGGFLGELALRGRGIDPDTYGLLWIPGHGAPAFQFDENGLRAVVQQANQCLASPNNPEPYSVAKWWLLPNVWLQKNVVPVNLIGRVPDDTLVQLAYFTANN